MSAGFEFKDYRVLRDCMSTEGASFGPQIGLLYYLVLLWNGNGLIWK